MAFDKGSLGTFADLAQALGILNEAGKPNSAWFADPVAGGDVPEPNGLKYLMADEHQRNALIRFVDSVLGPPEARTEYGARWVPLFANVDPTVTVYAVVEPDPDAHETRLGIGVEHTTKDGPPTVGTRIHVPLFRFADKGHDLGGTDTPWLLLGRPGGEIALTVDATITTEPPAPGAASLGGVAATVRVPTHQDDDLGLALELRDLQLPGATAPRGFSLDIGKPDEFRADLLDLVAGLIRAQADALANDPNFRPFTALARLLGLGRIDVPDFPELPVADLPTRGLQAVVDWLESVLGDEDFRTRWLGELRALLGENATVDAARNAVVFDLAPLTLTIGVRIESGSTGRPILTPWVEVALNSRAGTATVARAAVDLLRADTGTRTVTAIPDVSLEAVFGSTADKLIGTQDSSDPRVDSLRVGLSLDTNRKPVFRLTAHGVRLAGGELREVVDLSTPGAVLNVGTGVLGDALEQVLDQALDALGEAAPLVKWLLGVDPPPGITGLDVTELFRDPLAALRGYWRRLVADRAALQKVLNRLARLITGRTLTQLPGDGTEGNPWRIELEDPLHLHVWGDGTTLHLRLALEVATEVLGDYTATTALAVHVAEIDLAAGTVTLLRQAALATTLARTDGSTARIGTTDVELLFDELTVELVWTPTAGVHPVLSADGLALHAPALEPLPGIGDLVPIPLPAYDPARGLVFDAPDWDAVESAIAALVRRLRAPELDALLDLLGWYRTTARLRLADLLGGDPGTAIRIWLADLLLDCDTVRAALGSVARLLSRSALDAPLGTGSPDDPFRCPAGGDPRAPGLRARLEPGCAVRPEDVVLELDALTGAEPPEPEAMAATLRTAGRLAPDLGDLMAGRDSVATGFQALLDRWTGGDGLIGPTSVPTGVQAHIVDGLDYDTLVARATGTGTPTVGDLLAGVLDPASGAVVHAGCEASWLAGKPADSTLDLSGTDTPLLPDDATGTWYLQLPTPQQAAAARPDLGGTGGQAARLQAALAGRTAPIVLIGYGAAGAAAIRVASAHLATTAVVTVGTPWTALATDSLRSGVGGDALRLLDRLVDHLAVPDDHDPQHPSPLMLARALVTRSLAHLDPSSLPDAVAEPRRPGLDVHAVFGTLTATEVAAGLGELLAAGISARLEARTTDAPGPATALHLGVDVPVLDLDLGGGLVLGVGAAVELTRIGRPETGSGIETSFERTVVIDVQLGVHDGWLVGGPGSTTGAGDLRWASARVTLPLATDNPADAQPATAELVLHEATGLGIDRERWVIRGNPTEPAATAVVPEVRPLISSVMARLRAASPELARALEALGLLRAGGVDFDALDRLLLDTLAMLRARLATEAADLADALRELIAGAAGTGTTLEWTIGSATVSVDLAAGTMTLEASLDRTEFLPTSVTVTVSPTWATATVSVGEIHPQLGGYRLQATSPATLGPPGSASLEVGLPRQPLRTLELWPTHDSAGIAELTTVALPAFVLEELLQKLLDLTAGTGRTLLLEALDALGLLADPATTTAATPSSAPPATARPGFGPRKRRLEPVIGPASDGSAATPAASPAAAQRVRVPLASVADPAAWLVERARARSLNPAVVVARVLDALARLTTPGRGSRQGWPFVDGVLVDYTVVGERLRVTISADLELDLDGTTVRTTAVAGALLGVDAPPQPILDVTVLIEAHGLHVMLDPDLRITLLRPTPAAPLPLYPAGPGLGQAINAGIDVTVESLIPMLLDELAELADLDAAVDKFRHDIGVLVRELGDALNLRAAGTFTAALIAAFAQNPAAALLTQVHRLLGQAAGALVEALDPDGVLVRLDRTTNGVTFVFGVSDAVSVTVTNEPSIEITAHYDIPDLGPVALESLRVTPAGSSVAARLGPFPVGAGPVILRPLLVVRAGSNQATGRVLALGLALDDDAAESVELRWTLDATPPRLLAVDRDTTGTEVATSPLQAPTRLLAISLGQVAGIVGDALGPLLDNERLQRIGNAVVFETGRTIDPQLGADLLDPEALLQRLQRLLWNAATDDEPLSLAIETVKIALASTGTDDDKQLGVNVSLTAPYAFPTSGTQVTLEVDDDWLEPAVTGGLTVYAVHGLRTPETEPGAGDEYTFTFEPAVTVAGLGVRFKNEAGPLLDLDIMSLDGIAVHVYAEASGTGTGGGVQLELDGLAMAPAAGGGANPVAKGILDDAAAQSSPASRPSLGARISVQQHPGKDKPEVTLRGGDPPGPWWVLVQRQVGPLYVEQVGLDATEIQGRVTQVRLLFDGRVEIFGLTAAIDDLSITWAANQNGDIFDATAWEVDLRGLAISADMGAIAVAGGLLKAEIEAGSTGYVGMLLGRFGIYGLSLFGGYTVLQGDPSFFVFGAVNGPIGGPPAFFVTGLGGGLGINRKLKVPSDPAEFPGYPFIQALDPFADVGKKPADKLRDLNNYFPPELGTFWFAGGLSFTSFSLVDGIAVVAVSFGNAGLDINLVGLARMVLPNPAAPLVSVELGLRVLFSTGDGVFLVQAALTDNSWLLYPDVRLSGGFAFAVWWKGPLAGQFVLTLGGYHPDFRRAGYPEVQRLGLCWQVSDAIVIKGGAYFALTSEALMAGVKVTAAADWGWAWAHVDFGADALVYFDPFWFTADVWGHISAGITIDIPVVGPTSISVSTGVTVHVEGPEFSGRASVEVGPCTVTVPFGTDRRRPTPVLDWPGFVAKYLEQASPGHARALSAITGRGTLPPATGGAVHNPGPDGSAARPFEVYAEFEITFTTTIPTTHFDIGGVPALIQPTRSDGAAATLGLKPMNAGGLDSRVAVTLRRLGPDGPDTAGLAALAASRVLGTGAYPMGVWAAPDRSVAEAPALPTGDIINAGNQIRLTADAASKKAGPEIDYYTVEAGRRPLPLQQPGTDRGALLDLAGTVKLPTVSSVEKALQVAADILFAPPEPEVDGGPRARGERSNLARAAYRRQVAAPPLLGQLTDGLAIENGDAATVEVQPPAPLPAAPASRSPRVLGYLTGGSRVARREAGTTVADRTIKRRAAPTIASVRTRLGRSLPVSLDLTVPPAAKVGRTVTPRTLPFTAVPGTARSFRSGDGPATNRIAGLSGLGGATPGKGARAVAAAGIAARTEDAAPTLVSGDVVALQFPDHTADVDESRRPMLDLGGTARLVCVRGDGLVLQDAVVDGQQPIPTCTELVVVQADGTAAPAEGLAGWHTGSRVAAIGSQTGLAAGCALDVEAPAARSSVTWTTAGALIRGADAIATRFSTTVSTVVLVIEADDPERVGDLGLELTGATRATDPDGRQVDPELVVNGNQSVAVYPVVPGGEEPVTVRVVAGGGWRVTGVLGSAEPVGPVVAMLRRHGVAAATGRLLAVEGPGCHPEWIPAKTPRTPRTPKTRGGRGARR